MNYNKFQETTDLQLMKHLTKKLFSSLVIFSIGSLAVRGIQFVLLPWYTSQLTPQAYGTAEIWAGTAELISPVVILGIHEAMFRFAVQQEEPQNTFTTGISVGLAGSAVWTVGVLVFWGVLGKAEFFFMLFLALFTGFRMAVSQFLRGMGWAKRYTAAGVCQAVSLAVFQFALLPGFGSQGYLSALLLSQLAGALAAVGMGKLWNYWKPRTVWKNPLSRQLSRRMIQYSLPMIPAAFFCR